MNGHDGQTVARDLSEGRIWEEPLNEEYARLFVGGSGPGGPLPAGHGRPGDRPLGPENPSSS